MTHYPRFVHAPDSLMSLKHTGFTIAYVRDDTNIFFAVSFVSKNDQYSKKIGQSLTTNNLFDHIDDIPANTHYNPDTRLGCVTINSIRLLDPLTAILGDHVELSCMDLKHSFISSVLFESIESVY